MAGANQCDHLDEWTSEPQTEIYDSCSRLWRIYLIVIRDKYQIFIWYAKVNCFISVNKGGTTVPRPF